MAQSAWPPDRSEQGMLQAFRALSSGLAERPGVYGVSEADAAEAGRLAAVAEEAAFVASCPSTRTVLTTAAKREAIAAALKFCAPLAAFVRFNPNLSDGDRLAIGVRPKAEKRRVPPPSTAPILAIRGIIPGGHELEFYDSAAPGRRALAKDTKGLELFVAYSPNNGNSDAALSLDTMTKSAKPHAILKRGLSKVMHPNERVGSVANYIGRWINNRREAGPWSQPVRMLLVIPGQSSLSQAA
jgi:hypothetical protein